MKLPYRVGLTLATLLFAAAWKPPGNLSADVPSVHPPSWDSSGEMHREGGAGPPRRAGRLFLSLPGLSDQVRLVGPEDEVVIPGDVEVHLVFEPPPGLDGRVRLVMPVTRRPREDDHAFATPAPMAAAVTIPAGLEGWIQWSLDDEPAAVGRVFMKPVVLPGSHEITAHLFGSTTPDSCMLTIYRASLWDADRGIELRTGVDVLSDGVVHRLKARTDPPGFEDRVNWLWTNARQPPAGTGRSSRSMETGSARTGMTCAFC